MKTSEIYEKIAILDNINKALEAEYIDGGGEVTATTEQLESERQAVADLLEGDGIDGLGRWLKGKQDLRATGQDRVKGTCYTFKQYTSDKCAADTALLKERYHDAALAAIHAAGIPVWVTLTLGASASLVPEGQELPDVFVHTVTPTASMLAPKKVEE